MKKPGATTSELPPAMDDGTYGRLPKTVSAEFDRIKKALPGLLVAKSLSHACRQAAPGCRITYKALYERVGKFIRTRDWLDLVNKSKGGKVFWKPSAPRPAGLRKQRRPRGYLAPLTHAQRKRLCRWLNEENLSYPEALLRIKKDFGVVATINSLQNFWATYCSPRVLNRPQPPCATPIFEILLRVSTIGSVSVSSPKR